MRRELLDLRRRVQSELCNVQKTAQRVLKAWEGISQFPEQQSYYIDSVALNLHSFYNGLERIFVVIARELDPVFPSGERWHRDLLEQMGREIPEKRPAILSERTRDLLDEFLAFRHLIRSLYAFELDAERLKYLLDRLPEALSSAKHDIESLCRLLSIAAEQDSKKQEI